MDKIPIALIGVSGYTGLELIKILLNHPVFEISHITNTQGDQQLSDIHPSLANVLDFNVEKTSEALIEKIGKKCKLAFLALPHKSSMPIAKKLLDFRLKVVDLSADYRLKISNYEKHYQTPHLDPQNLNHAVYGLIEYARESIKQANLIANPGCYPTATLLGLLPFLDFLEDKSVFVDAKSGVSGAGKNPSANTHYPHINENIFSYAPLTHRHQIEIEEKCHFFGEKDLQVNFIPHLTPLTQGMLVSIFTRLKDNIDPLEILCNRYKNEPFIRIRKEPVEVKNVRGSHFCDIFVAKRQRDLYINVAIDNLLRGASSQAIVNANLMCGLDESLAIPKVS